jgi:hypothetical protein
LKRSLTLSAAAAAFALAGSAQGATLLTQWTFDEATSGTTPAIDTGAPPASNGTFMGGATRTTDTPGGFSTAALDLNTPGAGTYLTAGDADEVDGLTSFTLTTWLNLLDPTSGGNNRLVAKQTGGTFDGFSWNMFNPVSGTRSADNWRPQLFVGGSGGFQFAPATQDVGSNTGEGDVGISAATKWVFLAVVYDGSLATNNTTYYVGDVTSPVVQLGTPVTIAAGTVTANTAELAAGFTSAAPTADTAAPGLQDDVRVYSGTSLLSELEAVRLANIPEPGTLLLAPAVALLAARRSRRR